MSVEAVCGIAALFTGAATLAGTYFAIDNAARTGTTEGDKTLYGITFMLGAATFLLGAEALGADIIPQPK